MSGDPIDLDAIEARCPRGHLLAWCAGCGDGICECDPGMPPLCWSCK